MQLTLLQKIFGMGALSLEMRLLIRLLVVVVALAFAVALRRRAWIFRTTGFVWIAIGVALDLLTLLMMGAPDMARAVAAIAVVFFFWGAVRLMMDGIEWMARHGRQPFSTILRDLIQLGLYATIVMLVLWADFHVNVAPLLATAGVLTVVLGLALQETLGNVFSGLALQLQKPFDPGDWIRTGQHVGRVLGIGVRSTTIMTRANERLEVPNSAIAKDILINYGTPPVADEVAVRLGFEQPPNRVRGVILDVMRDIPGVLSEPEPAVFVWSYDEFAIHYRVKYWIADYALQEEVRDSVVASLWYALRRHSIEIPFPVRSVEVRRPRAARKPEREYENAIIAELRQVDFLRALSHEELGMLVPRVRIHQFGSGEALVREGERGQSLYIIRDGVVGVTVQHSDGSQRHVANLTRPAIVGEMGMMTGEPRTATVKARTDVEVLEVGREAFGELFRKHPEAVNQISEIIAARMTEQREVRTAEAGADAGSARRNWLVAKMRQIFDI